LSRLAGFFSTTSASSVSSGDATTELLTSGQLDRVRQCPGCKWVFVDDSPKHNRVWCDMRICGNRAKVQRHYRRQKSQRLVTG
jgi:predicted RNA-binding Zn ribbon-like protein